MTEAPAPIEQAAQAETNARIAMSAAWLVVAYLDGQGSRRRLSADFHDAFGILQSELAEAGYLERYRDPETGVLQLPPLEARGLRSDKTAPAECDSVFRPQLKGTNP